MGIFDKFKKNKEISEILNLKIKADDLVESFQFEEAISCLNQALKINELEQNSDETKSMLLRSKGKIWRKWAQYFSKQEKFHDGMECYSKAFKCYDELKKYCEFDDIDYLNLAEMNGDLGQFHKAKKYFLKSEHIAFSYTGGFSADQLDVYIKAPHRIKKLIAIKRKNKNFPKIISFWNYGKNTYSSQNHYLVEFRFSGFAKQSIKELKTNITKKFGVTRRKIVPHITIAGPVSTGEEKQLLNEIADVCKNYNLVKFKMDGFDNFEDRVIYVKINPSQELKNLRLEISERLYKFCNTTKFDQDENFTFHATLVLKDIQRKFDRIWDYVQTWRIPEMDQYVLRITIIKNQRILAEYDLILKKLLGRRESLDKEIYKKTLKKLEKMRESTDREFQDLTNEKIYFFSDAHFDHKNIIKYCNRPFNSTREMNQVLVENWDDSVKDNDTVFFLGDMSYGRDRKSIDYWLEKLTGKILYIRGNHDKDIINRANVIHSHYGIRYNDYQFLLMHDPRRPNGYDGWIIHGDKHNNNLKEYPFINQKNKTVNVCAELVKYTPLNVDKLITLIETGRSYKTIQG